MKIELKDVDDDEIYSFLSDFVWKLSQSRSLESDTDFLGCFNSLLDEHDIRWEISPPKDTQADYEVWRR